MKSFIRMTVLPALLLIASCSGQNTSDRSWHDDSDSYPAMQRDYDPLQMNSPRSRADYEARQRERYSDYRKIQREQMLQNRGRMDNSTDSGGGMGQPVRF